MEIVCKHTDILTSKTHDDKIVNEYIIYVFIDDELKTPACADVVYGEDDRDILIRRRYLEYFDEGDLISRVLRLVSHSEFKESIGL